MFYMNSNTCLKFVIRQQTNLCLLRVFVRRLLFLEKQSGFWNGVAELRVRNCKPFKEPRNRFLGSLNVYKYGLCKKPFSCGYDVKPVLEFYNNLWGQEPRRNGVVVPARQAT
jgi:hypothetical protein